ncbi:MAG TPA: hypothetical protein VG099_03775 [Gemmataceae bacterium]|jgi:hypothetical protein|nr:hypothetical protein [Gemmataceae bacterium]
MTANFLSLWVITYHPSDFPKKFVLREHRVSGTWQFFMNECILCDTLDQARRMLPAGLVNIGRYPDDDPVIVEVWL